MSAVFPYHGLPELKTNKGGPCFSVANHKGIWWFITPTGHAFISKGVTRVNYLFDEPVLRPVGFESFTELIQSKYADEKRWAVDAAVRLRAWGFNTIGSSSHPATWSLGLPYLVNLHLAVHSGGQWLKRLPDVFSPEFTATVRDVCRNECAKHVANPCLIGYFTDNELGWRRSPLTDYLELPAESAGSKAAAAFLRDHGVEQVEADSPLHDMFREQVARRYFAVCHAAIREYDSHHLILGVRFANGYAPDSVLRAMASYVDVLTVNSYAHSAPEDILRHMHAVTGLPVMITEFSFKAMDSGLPNTKGAGIPVATQQDRADGFERFVDGLMGLPFLIGYQWFQYMDEPKEGRFDGENCNYGLITLDDDLWQVLTNRTSIVNARSEEIHKRSTL